MACFAPQYCPPWLSTKVAFCLLRQVSFLRFSSALGDWSLEQGFAFKTGVERGGNCCGCCQTSGKMGAGCPFAEGSRQGEDLRVESCSRALRLAKHAVRLTADGSSNSHTTTRGLVGRGGAAWAEALSFGNLPGLLLASLREGPDCLAAESQPDDVGCVTEGRG